MIIKTLIIAYYLRYLRLLSPHIYSNWIYKTFKIFYSRESRFGYKNLLVFVTIILIIFFIIVIKSVQEEMVYYGKKVIIR